MPMPLTLRECTPGTVALLSTGASSSPSRRALTLMAQGDVAMTFRARV
jgi:hypothetical protein